MDWSPANNGLPAANVSALVIDPSNPATLYAGTDGGGVFKSTNGGGSWSPANNGLSNTYVSVLAIDPSNPATLYAGGDGMFKSTNGGGSWSQVSNAASVSFEVIDPSNPDTLYVGIVPSPSALFGIYKSTDGGISWSPANNGLIARNVFALAIDPSNPAMLYAGTNTGVFKSTNGGGNWSPLNSGLPNTSVVTLVIDPTHPAILYAGTEGAGVFKFTRLDSIECLFNWAERNYPDLLAPAASPTAASNLYTYRYYLATHAYLGVSSMDNHVYYKGPDGKLQDEGPLSDWLPKADCQVSAPPPIECTFNWAERNYPTLLAPAGSPTAASNLYTYRYYSATHAYLGISSADNHVYYKGPDGKLQDEGSLSDWLPKAGC
jgi:hypothetical protein